ncbi:MAG: dihydroorotase, partial [Alphaproteobacteria bacterium]
KMLPFGQAASGAAGVETLLPLAFSLFHTHSISLTKIVNALSVAPAKTLSLPIPKLAIGTKANITIVKLSSSSVIRGSDFISQSQITPFEHYLIDSKVAGCFVNGISVTS